MSTNKQFICLANSRKLSGFCVAGIELVSNKPTGWIRPVSEREHEEVSLSEQEYQDGTLPTLLDIIDIALLEPKPHDFQKENWLLNPGFYWDKAGTYPKKDLKKLIKPSEHLWIDGVSTREGLNDEVPLWKARALESSLILVHVDEFSLLVGTFDGYNRSRRRVQGHFTHLGVQYRLWITDPSVERSYFPKPDGVYSIKGCYLRLLQKS